MKQVKQDIEEKDKAYKYFDDAGKLYEQADKELSKSKYNKANKFYGNGIKIMLKRKLNDKTKYRKALRLIKDARITFNYDKDLERYNQEIVKAEELAKYSEPDYEKILNTAKEKIIMYQKLYDTDVFKLGTKASE